MGNALHTPGAPGVGAVTPAHARLADAGLLAVQGPSLINTRTGVMHGPGSTALVTGTGDTAPMAYLVAPHHWVTSRGVASDGVYRGGLETATRVTTTAAPGSGSRTDVIWVKQNDQHSTISPDANTDDVYGCTQGTVGGGKPAIPVGALELATATVAAGATATNGAGVTITNTARQTVAHGAPIPVRSQAERDALTAFDGLTVTRLDVTGCPMETWDGGWRRYLLEDDTGWLNVVVSTPTYAGMGGSEQPQVRRIGKLCKMRGGFDDQSMSPNGTHNVGSLPAGFPPPPGQSASAPLGSSIGDGVATGFVTTSGGIQIRPPSTVGAYYKLDALSWLVD